MSRQPAYEGLNLPELLRLMHDIVLAEPVPWTPQTVGWAIVGTWLLVLGVLVAWHGVKTRRRNRYRREALAMLDAIATEPDPDPAVAAQQVATLLKRTALVAYPRVEVAGLHGGEWAAFLRRSARNDPLVEHAAIELAGAAYRPDADGRCLIEPARRWIEVHDA